MLICTKIITTKVTGFAKYLKSCNKLLFATNVRDNKRKDPHEDIMWVHVSSRKCLCNMPQDAGYGWGFILARESV